MLQSRYGNDDAYNPAYRHFGGDGGFNSPEVALVRPRPVMS